MPSTPCTVFTGYLGSGKTSLIVSLVKRLPSGYRISLLKNEFGDVEVDSHLAGQSSISSVSEILNGCMCCVLVGQMKSALIEIEESQAPDRIVVECSGEALPATIAWQIRALEKEGHGIHLDSVVTVIDCENFMGYKDTSPTAQIQAKYCDVLLLNKWESLDERRLDKVLDHLYSLYPDTPKLKTVMDQESSLPTIDPDLIFELDTRLFSSDLKPATQASHTDEIETLSIWLGGPAPGHSSANSEGENRTAIDTASSDQGIDVAIINKVLESFTPDIVYRVKGFVLLKGTGLSILNYAFGRSKYTEVPESNKSENIAKIIVRLTMMGSPGLVRSRGRRLAEALNANVK